MDVRTDYRCVRKLSMPVWTIKTMIELKNLKDSHKILIETYKMLFIKSYN